MLELTISRENKKHFVLKDKLENLSSAQRVILSQEILEPALKDGNNVYSGYDEIFIFLEEYEVFERQWYECRCGNHGEENEK